MFRVSHIQGRHPACNWLKGGNEADQSAPQRRVGRKNQQRGGREEKRKYRVGVPRIMFRGMNNRL